MRSIERKISDGELKHGTFVRTSTKMVQEVANDHGGIGYLPGNFILFTADNVKVINIK
jgi:hypothetical protein